MNEKIKNFLACFGILAFATLFCLLLMSLNNNEGNVAAIFTLATFLIAKYTTGYVWGIFSAFFGVVCVNYAFTYPYFELNFSHVGYPLTFVCMLTVSLVTSAMTTNIYKQNQLAQKQEALLMEAEKEKMRSNLLRAVSHDLRTPLAGMIGSSSTYLETKNYLSEEEKDQLVQGIYEDANWLLHMVENLLSVTRIQHETTKVTKVEEVLEEVVSEALIRFQKRYPDTNVDVLIPDDFLLVPMDATLIEQVLINLLENAVIHGNSSERIDLVVQYKKDAVYFYVKDYGTGIVPVQLPSIFDGSPISNEDKNDRRKGMGIGLTICKTIIVAHGGQIYARNHDNGAEFYFWLPLKEEN